MSLEAKEKLHHVVNNNRKDPKRIFLAIYTLWIEFESKGIMKLDKFARDIFFKHAPFSKSIRDQLKKSPGLLPFVTRYENISQKQVDRLEMRYRQRKDKDGNLPKVLIGNLAFYKR